MRGYRDRSDHEIFGEQPKPTRLDWVVAVAAIIAGLFVILGSIARHAGAPAWLERFDFGIAPLGFVEFFLGYTFILRARANAEGERFSPRALRRCAVAFFLFGAILIGIGLYAHFKGA